MMPSSFLLPQPLAVYVHWPFCKAKCPYCDFNSHVREQVDQQAWREALVAELRWFAAQTPGRCVTSVFFGGGTPSLMPPETVGAVLDTIHALWTVDEQVEITLEANPTSVEAARFREFRAAGVNRVSLGVQALNGEDLQFLGRQHDTNEALEAVALARRIFPRYSFDLIYARPGQSLAAWERELREALRHAGDHLSVYQLTIEENTAFYHAYHSKRAFALPGEDNAADLFTLTQAVLEDAGLPAYEISNHARPGGESRHNLAYWQGGDYLGIGPGAHGRYRNGSGGARIATETLKSPERWLEHVATRGHGIALHEPLSASIEQEERVMMGLRLSEGINRAAFAAQTGTALEEAVSKIALQQLIASGHLELTPHALRATTSGRLVLQYLTHQLLDAN